MTGTPQTQTAIDLRSVTNGPPHRGAARPWTLARGATVLIGGGVRFGVWAPDAAHVAVRVYQPGGPADHALARRADGVHEIVVAGVEPGTDYRFVLDGDRELPDPVSRWQPHDVHGPSRVVDPAAFRWTDASWRGIAMPDYVIYELHVGTFSDEGTFDGAIPHLAGLAALGVTAIELMPVAEFPGGRNWGYDGVHLYAPESAYGGPDGLRRLVDAAHAAGLAVVLDVVYNHLGPEGNYLGAFGPYFTDTYHTPWGAAVNYDGAGSDEVRRFVIENALYWVSEFHVDALRLDAVHGIFDMSATHVLQEVTARVHEQAAALGRTVCLIAESDLNDPKMVRPVAEHGFGFDAQWSDDFHHAVHVALTGERRGYYADFADDGLVAAALREPFVYDGRHSAHRGRRHGGSSAGIPRWRFVVAVQNHDQIGNRATGDRLTTLVPFERQKLGAALLLLSPYVPLLFMGEEYGETSPFQYFVSHTDPALVDAVRDGRRREFVSFGWEDDVPDPQAVQTFERSKLDRSKVVHPRHAAIHALHRDLLRTRREQPALRPGAAHVAVPDLGAPGLVAQLLTPDRGGARLIALFNLSDSPHSLGPDLLGPELLGRGSAHVLHVLLSTSDPLYGGPGAAHLGSRFTLSAFDTVIDLPPSSAVLLRADGDGSHAAPGTRS